MGFDRNKAAKYLTIAQDGIEPKNETIAEHRKHCEAKPGNCPFEKELKKQDEADVISKGNDHNSSELDAAYADAVKHGDKQAALRMVREAAAKAMPNTNVVGDDGLPMVVYHGTNRKFNVFKIGDIGFHFGSVGQANSAASERRGKVKSFFIDIKNPYILKDDPEVWADKFSPFLDSLVKHKIISSADRENVGIEPKDPYAAMNTIRSKLESLGYDGITYPNYYEVVNRDEDGSVIPEDSYIAFQSSQIKSADITYDDAGKLIPLSKRFNPHSDDIRY